MPKNILDIIRYLLPFALNFIKSKEVPFVAKFLLVSGSIYLVSFIDLIPDFIPFLGLVDDVIIVPLLVGGGYKMVTSEIIKKLWEKTMVKTTIHPLS
jgi:uncharacterized membrane protein YkvA (DUF1232 family)